MTSSYQTINNRTPLSVLTWARDNLAFLLILFTLVLFTSKSLYNIPVGIMAVLGLWQSIASRGKIFLDPVVRGYTCLFLALWLPLLISLPDAANFQHSAQTVFPYLRFLFMGIYILYEKNSHGMLPKVRLAIFCVVVFWAIDGCIQYLIGFNLAGFPYEAGHITGMFYPRNTIAHILAALSPLFFESIRIYSKRYKWSWLLILPVIAVILLSGRRAAWIMLAMSLAGYSYYLFKYTSPGRAIKKKLLVVFSAGLITGLIVILSNTPLQDRILTTAGLFSLDYEAADIAMARRLPIWETAIVVFRENWINGVGPRGFRHVYQQYSDVDNFWYASPPTHPHQLLLEVAAETGLAGLTGLLLFAWLFIRLLFVRTQLPMLFPWILSVLIIIFPFSSNLAFYSSYWASIIWWFLSLTILALKQGLRVTTQPAEAST
jgi:O-antigen ligase